MDAPTAPAAPAQPAAPTVSATIAAATTNDFAAFDRAHVAQREGKPLAPVTPEVPAPAAAAPAQPAADAPPASAQVSKRQQQINDYERRIAEQNERIARLESQVKPVAASAPAQPDPVKPPTASEWKRYREHPDAPKLADFESVEDHTAAMALFVADTRHDERIASDQQRQRHAAESADLDTRVETYGQRMQQAKAADPEIGNKIAPELKAAHPISGYPVDEKTGQRIDPATGQPLRVTFAHIVAEVGFRYSENPAAFYAHLTANAAEMHRIAALPSQDVFAALVDLNARVTGASAAPAAPSPSTAAVPSTITAAPPPPPTLSRAASAADPQTTAVARGDFAAFDRIEMQKKRAQRTSA